MTVSRSVFGCAGAGCCAAGCCLPFMPRAAFRPLASLEAALAVAAACPAIADSGLAVGGLDGGCHARGADFEGAVVFFVRFFFLFLLVSSSSDSSSSDSSSSSSSSASSSFELVYVFNVGLHASRPLGDVAQVANVEQRSAGDGCRRGGCAEQEVIGRQQQTGQQHAEREDVRAGDGEMGFEQACGPSRRCSRRRRRPGRASNSASPGQRASSGRRPRSPSRTSAEWVDRFRDAVARGTSARRGSRSGSTRRCRGFRTDSGP